MRNQINVKEKCQLAGGMLTPYLLRLFLISHGLKGPVGPNVATDHDSGRAMGNHSHGILTLVHVIWYGVGHLCFVVLAAPLSVT